MEVIFKSYFISRVLPTITGAQRGKGILLPAASLRNLGQKEVCIST